MSLLRVEPGPVSGTVRAPPSKSVTHRAFLLAALSKAPSTVASPLRSQDTLATLAGLHALGAHAEAGEDAVRFTPAPLHPPAAPLDCRNSGTTLRLLAATAARLGAPVHLDGDASLRRRPSTALLQALTHLGARVRSRDGCPPVSVQGPLRPGHVALPPDTTSQAATALLMALPFLDGPSVMVAEAPVASRPYLDVTRQVLSVAGIEVRMEESPAGLRFDVAGNQSARLGAFRVEGDWSAAAFPLAAACVAGGETTVTDLDPRSAQGDRAILSHLAAFGATVVQREDGATVRHNERPTSPGTLDVRATPDLFPPLVAVAAVARGRTTFTGLSQLRVKESDRVRAMAGLLAAAGITCQATQDAFVVEGGRPRAVAFRCHDDHRIHMAAVLLALAADGPSTVDSASSASVSYPAFHDDLSRLGARLAAPVEAPA